MNSQFLVAREVVPRTLTWYIISENMSDKNLEQRIKHQILCENL